MTAAGRGPSLARNSLARFAADASALILGSIAAVITARTLGPSGQGLFASIFLLSSIGLRLCSFGLGEASIVYVGQGEVSRQHGLEAGVAGVLAASSAGVLPYLAVSVLLVGPDDRNTWLALLAGAALLTAGAIHDVLSQTLNGQERLVATSRNLVLVSGLTLLGLVGFVIVLDLGVLGGVLAGAVATTVGALVAATLLKRAGFFLRPRWHSTYLAEASRYGLRLQLSHILTLAAGRADLLLVLTLLGENESGHYSVALTIGTLAGLGSFAMSYAIFPRLPALDRTTALQLAARVARLGLTSALLTAVPLAAITPVLIPGMFGSAYDEAVIPAMFLILGGIPLSGQWMLGRSAAALGDPALLARSFGVSLTAMILLDLAAVPLAGLPGAAGVSAASSALGFAYCVYSLRQHGVRFSALIPRSDDFREVQRQLLSLWRPRT